METKTKPELILTPEKLAQIARRLNGNTHGIKFLGAEDAVTKYNIPGLKATQDLRSGKWTAQVKF